VQSVVKNWRSLYRLYHAPDCPRWTIGDWCPFCAAFHHSYPGCWCYSGGCPKDNSAYNADGALGFRNNRWRGFDGDLTLLDYRFVLPAPCCVCEEHLSSWYSGTPEWRLEEASGNIDAVYIDGNGDVQPLPLGTMTEALHIKGKSPSSAPNDSRVIVKATVQPVGGNEISATFTTLVTVASTRVVENINDDVAQSIDARLEHIRTNGIDRIWANRLFVPFYLISDVEIDSHLILSLEGDMTARVWSGNSTNSTLLLTTGQTITNGVSVINGQTVNFATHGQASQVWLQVLSPGTGAISYGFVGKDGAEGISFTDTLPITAYYEELKVQVMSESNYMAGIGTGPAVNPDAVAAFNLNSVMQSVAALYSNDTRGCGIKVTWTNTPFTMPVVPHDYNDGTFVSNLYRYTGDIECVVGSGAPVSSVITNGTMWIFSDMKLRAENLAYYNSLYGAGDMVPLIMSNRNDVLYGDYVKVAFPSRTGKRLEDGSYQTMSINHARALNVGAYIDVVSISEEKFIDGETNYTAQVFIDVLEFCTGHEPFHLITNWQELANTPPFDEPGPLMGRVRPLNLVTITEEEILWIDLPNRKSIVK